MASLIEYVRRTVQVKAYYQSVFPNVRWPIGNEARVSCVFHKEKTPSLSLNPDSGAWFCHGCSAAGKSIISFHSDLHNLPHRITSEQLYQQFVRPIISDESVRKWHRNLLNTPRFMEYLMKNKYLSESTINFRRLGFDGHRIVIPIVNEFKICVNAKLYDPLGKRHNLPKMINFRRDGEERSFGSPEMLYPLDVMDEAREEGKVVVCEGEWDCLLMNDLGIHAVTTTAGSKSWPSQYNEEFRGLDVIVAYDNDKDGIKYDKRTVLKNIIDVARKVRRLDIPKIEMGEGKQTKDIADWYKVDSTMRTKSAWEEQFAKARVLADNPDQKIEAPQADVISLDQASMAKWFKKSIQVDALITGKDSAPYLLPKKFRISCDKSCDSCPLGEGAKEFKEVKINPSDIAVMSLIDQKEPAVRKALMGISGFKDAKSDCNVKIDIVETFNIERVLLIPTLDSGSAQAVSRYAYFVGHGLFSNRAYRFHGVTAPDPENQLSTHLFSEAKPVQDEIETFQLNEEMKKKLMIFRPKRLSLLGHLMGIADWQSRNITKIRMRHDLHIFVDLVFHSLREFEFNGEAIKRGMLDAIVIGDTRCGKGYVAERLSKFYRLGEVASGECCSFAGLIGGLDNPGKNWIVKWGVIPLNNGRLVVIDEASAITQKEFSEMSRVRSEGVAEINKIKHETTQANTRLIWLSNTRRGESLEEGYNTGIEALKELMGANEDLSRFDIAMAVACNEVPTEIINAVEEPPTDGGRYPADVARSLVLWAWSRRPDQIQFTKKATEEIISQAIRFGRDYSSSIPLVQAENIRIKIAKVSASVAARVFSSDAGGENVIIDWEHVRCACEFMRICFDKPSMGYDRYSHKAMEGTGSISLVFKSLGNFRQPACKGMSALHRITPDSLADYVSDTQLAKSIIGDLVKARCLSRQDQGWYLKSPAFSAWLREPRNWESNGNGKTY